MLTKWKVIPKEFAFSLVLAFCGIGCAAEVATAGNSTTTSASSAVATPTIQPHGRTLTTPPSVSIADSIANATIYCTTDGSTATSASPVYSGASSLTSATTVQAMACASGYNNRFSSFKRPVGSDPITIKVNGRTSGF